MVNQFSGSNPPFISGVPVLEHYCIEGESVWGNLGIVFAFAAAFLMICWTALSFKKYDRR